MEKEIITENNRKHGIHITHNDADAVGCALVVSSFDHVYDFVENTYFCAIGKQDKVLLSALEKDIENNNIPEYIIITDISLSESTCDYLEELSRNHNIKLLGIDHHATNNLNEKYEWFKVYKEKYYQDKRFPNGTSLSAAMYMLIYLCKEYDVIPPKAIYTLIDMISRYDTWEWKNQPYEYEGIYAGIKEDVIATICKFMGPEKTFMELYKLHKPYSFNPSKLYPDLFQSIYDVEVGNRNYILSKVDSKIRLITMDNYTCALFISDNNYSNDIADYIKNTYDFIDMSIAIYPNSNRISFRPGSDDIDVGKLAEEKYNGGGHPKAAGAIISDESMAGFMHLYYMHSKPLEKYIGLMTTDELI